MKPREPRDEKTTNLNLRIPNTLKEQVRQLAKEEGRSISNWVIWQLKQLISKPNDR